MKTKRGRRYDGLAIGERHLLGTISGFDLGGEVAVGDERREGECRDGAVHRRLLSRPVSTGTLVVVIDRAVRTRDGPAGTARELAVVVLARSQDVIVTVEGVVGFELVAQFLCGVV